MKGGPFQIDEDYESILKSADLKAPSNMYRTVE
jgi:hypothetical protein